MRDDGESSEASCTPFVQQRMSGTAAIAVLRHAMPLRVDRACATLLVAAGCIAMFLPLALTAYLSTFGDAFVVFPPSGYSLKWYAAILPKFGDAIGTSLELALLAALLSLAAGIPAGLGLVRHRFPGKGAVSTLLLSPLTVPGIAIGLGLFIFAVAIEEGTGLPLSGTFLLLVIGHVLITLPWVVRLCVASLANLDRAAEEAAASLGARPLRVLWRVTLPAIRPGIAAAGLFAFIVSFGDLEMTLFLITPGMTTLPIATLEYLQYHVDPLIAAVAVAQMAMIGILLAALGRLVRIGQVLR